MTKRDLGSILKDYSEDRRGTRATIEALGLRDYGDLIVVMAHANLPFPKPPDTPVMRMHRERAREILTPLLCRQGKQG